MIDKKSIAAKYTKIKLWILGLIGLVLVIGVFSFAIFLMDFYRQAIQRTIALQSSQDEAAVLHLLEDAVKETEQNARYFFDNPQLAEALSREDRNSSSRIAAPLFKTLSAYDPRIVNLHIALHDDASLVWLQHPSGAVRSPEQKALIAQANKTYEIQAGIECEKSDRCFFRVVYPIEYNMLFLGVAEFSLDLASIFKQVKQLHNLDIVLYGTTLDKKGRPPIFYTSSEQAERVYERSLSDKQKYYYDDKGTYYSVSTLEQRYLPEGLRLALIHNTDNIVKNKDAFTQKLYTYLFFISLTGFSIVFAILHYFIKQIRSQEIQTHEHAEQLYQISHFNQITGLPNAFLLSQELEKAEAAPLILLDINSFSIFNTTYGTEIADALLRTAAEYLSKTLYQDASLFHLRADEFAIVLHGLKVADAEQLCTQIKSFFEQMPITLDQIQTHVNFSFGIASAEEKNKLLKANIALREAKNSGNSLIVVYAPSMGREGAYAKLAKNIALLHRQLEKDSLVPFLQPIVNNKTGAIEKYEVLSRIEDQNEIVSPAEFMQAAEVSGLVCNITKIVVHKTFKYLAHTGIAFNINISRADLSDSLFLDFIKAQLKIHAVNPDQVTLEILESVTTEKDTTFIERITELHRLGFKIAIDDFGTESSNFSKLSDLPIDYLKIDGRFIKDLDSNEKHYRIVESIVFMAKKLNVGTVSEYVHNETIAGIVKEMGIDSSQGYYFGAPKSMYSCNFADDYGRTFLRQ